MSAVTKLFAEIDRKVVILRAQAGLAELDDDKCNALVEDIRELLKIAESLWEHPEAGL